MTTGVPGEFIWSAPDAVRAWLYRVAAPALGALYADRARRVLWLGVFSVATSLALTLVAPLWLLAVGPLLLGVPHLLSDVRYLVVRPGLHRRRAGWLAAVPLVAAGLGAGPVFGVVAMVPLVWAEGQGGWRRAGVLAAVGGLAVAALLWERAFLLGFLHVHNAVALGFWVALRRRDSSRVVVLVLALAGAAALLLGLFDGVITACGGWEAPASGASFDDLNATLTSSPEASWSTHVVLCFAFLQSLHYAVWLRLVPDDARQRPAPRPFAASWRALVRELGLGPMVAVTALAVLIAAWGLLDVAAARHGYLRLGAFHGYLELVVAAWLVTVGRRPAQ